MKRATRASTAEEALAAYDDCLAHPGRLSLIEIQVDPQAITPAATLDQLRRQATAAAAR